MGPAGAGAGAGYGYGPGPGAGRFGRFGGMFGGRRNNIATGPDTAQTGPAFPQPAYAGEQGYAHVRFVAFISLNDANITRIRPCSQMHRTAEAIEATSST